MPFAADVARDTVYSHADWARADITRRRRIVTGVSLIGSDPTCDTVETLITGVLTVVDESLRETVFGGMVAGDAVLSVLPAVDVQHNDEVVCDGITYRIEEVREEDVKGTLVQRYCRLVRTKP